MNTQFPLAENLYQVPSLPQTQFFQLDGNPMAGTFVNFNLFIKTLIEDNQRLNMEIHELK